MIRQTTHLSRVALATALVGLTGVSTGAAEPAQSRNIVFLLIDDLA